jgi:23S rRNA (cytosine1962-C5)-methyltransferase
MTADIPTAAVVLKRGKVRPIHAGHPWVFAGAVAELRGDPEPGDVVWVLDPSENTLGWGVLTAAAGLRVRMWGHETSTDGARLFETMDRRLEEAAARRRALGFPAEGTTAWRLANSEGDRLPGLSVDVLGGAAALRHASVATWRRRRALAEKVRELAGCEAVAHLVDPAAAGNEPIMGVPEVDGDEDATTCKASFEELGLSYECDLLKGQKTGHYLDQRPNRAFLRELAGGRKVLDLCTYTGGFTLNAAAAGASEAVGVDTSGPSLDWAEANARRNGLEAVRFVCEDAIRFCRAQAKGSFDLVVLDPPKLVHSRRHLDEGLKKYRAMNRAAIEAVSPGGLLMSFSCSAAVDSHSFLRVLGDAAGASGRTLHVHRLLSAGRDHPFLAQARETSYLCGVLASVSKR